jgi:peptide chain release factor subunit 1
VVAITEDDIRSLACFKGADAPVTTVYLDVDGARHLRPDDVVRSAERLTHDTFLRYADQPSVRADLERVEALVRGGFDRSRTRGVAVFSCTKHDFWKVVELPVRVRDQVVVNHSPAVRQLEAIVDEYERFGVLVADRQLARVLVYELGELVDSATVHDELPRGEDVDHSHRREKLASHVDDVVHHHLRRAADETFRIFQEQGFDRLILGATDEVAGELEDLLHPYLRERIEARRHIPIHATHDELRSVALAVEAEIERRKESELVDRLRDAVGGRRRGVAGLDDTLRALVEKRVDVLLVSAGFVHPGWRCGGCAYIGRVGRTCPVCQAEMTYVDDVVEEAIEEALAQSCEVEVCVGNADLDVLGCLGALLRY